LIQSNRLTKKNIVFIDSQGTDSKENPGSGSTDPKPKPHSTDTQTEEEVAALFNPYLPISMFKKQKQQFVCWQVQTCISLVWLTFIGYSTFNKD
jgi:hypothetical protein